MSIFRAYDIRGIHGRDIDSGVMEDVGRAFSSFRKGTLVLGRDVRLHSKEMSRSFANGALSAGADVIDIGEVPLGAGMFYAWKRKLPYAYITASHLPKEWTGAKFFHPDGTGFLEKEIESIGKIYEEKTFARGKGRRTEVKNRTVLNKYKDYLLSRIEPKASARIVLDCGNGAAGLIAGDLFREAGFSVEMLFEEPDGSFPNRSPDNKEDPLTELRRRSKNADFGISYDGDGDRMFMVDDKGNKIPPEHVAYIILEDLLKKEKGPVVANVEVTRAIDDIARRFSRRVVRIRVGHTFLMDAVLKNKACFGLESSGHFVVPSLLPFDDSLAISLYAASVIASSGKPLSDILNGIPNYPFRRISIKCSEAAKGKVMSSLRERLSKEHDINDMDGIRIELQEGWVLIRPSNTEPVIRLSIEADTEGNLNNISKRFEDIVRDEIENANSLHGKKA